MTCADEKMLELLQGGGLFLRLRWGETWKPKRACLPCVTLTQDWRLCPLRKTYRAVGADYDLRLPVLIAWMRDNQLIHADSAADISHLQRICAAEGLELDEIKFRPPDRGDVDIFRIRLKQQALDCSASQLDSMRLSSESKLEGANETSIWRLLKATLMRSGK